MSYPFIVELTNQERILVWRGREEERERIRERAGALLGRNDYGADPT